jgi:hypothetical protein
MKSEMRRVLAREPYEKKIQKVEQLLRLVREFPRQLKVSTATRAKSSALPCHAVVLTKEDSSGRGFNEG